MRFRVRKRLRRFCEYFLQIISRFISNIKDLFCHMKRDENVPEFRVKVGEDATCEFLKCQDFKKTVEIGD